VKRVRESRTQEHGSRKRRLGWRTKLGIVALAGTLGLSMNAASGAPNPMDVVAGPGSASVGYYVRTVVVLKGRTLTFRNLDITAHNVVSNKSLFSSGTPVGLGKSDRVTGVENLKKGSYAFYCTPHKNAMKGKLIVI
jgi:plastocyanin